MKIVHEILKKISFFFFFYTKVSKKFTVSFAKVIYNFFLCFNENIFVISVLVDVWPLENDGKYNQIFPHSRQIQIDNLDRDTGNKKGRRGGRARFLYKRRGRYEKKRAQRKSRRRKGLNKKGKLQLFRRRKRKR